MRKVAVPLVVVESSEIDDGLMVQPIFTVEDEGVQDRLTVPPKPPVPLTVMVEVPVCPAEEIVTLDGLAPTE
jgi:hypothetical protein